jgi:hypothetical protein
MQLRTEVEINAPARVVWNILVNRDAYHEWNPFITTFTGALEKGAPVNIVVSPPDSSDFRFRAHMLNVEPERELRWKGKVIADFCFCGEHYITLTSLGDEKTRVAHGENFGGFFLKFLLNQMGATQRGFVYMNQALKNRAEAHFAATGSDPVSS